MTTIYRLHIDAYTPESIPMATLARYMEGFAALLGHESAVHFGGLQDGSTQILCRVDREEVPKVRERLDQARRHEAPPEVMKHLDAIDRQIAADNAVGTLYEDTDAGQSAKILAFPGRNRPKPVRYGPFNQEGSLDGVLVSIGGVDQTISLQLLNGDIKYTGCETTRDLARQLARHLFEPIRIHGVGRWERLEDGAWKLKHFRVRGFDVLDRADLKDAVEQLRALQGGEWAGIDDPIGVLQDLRKGGTGPH